MLVQYKILHVGRPSDDSSQFGRSQGQLATLWERKTSRSVLNESSVYGDMILIARDTNRDMTDKVIRLFTFAISTAAS